MARYQVGDGGVAQDALLGATQALARFGAVFIDQAAADVLVDAQGLRRLATSVQGEHEVFRQRLVGGVAGRQRREVADDVREVALSEGDFCSDLGQGEALVVESGADLLGPQAGQAAQWFAANQTLCLVQQVEPLLVVAGVNQRTGLGGQGGVAVYVDRVSLAVQDVGIGVVPHLRPVGSHRVADGGAEPRDIRVERPPGVWRRRVLP
jgi:hypothetical protein